MIDLNIDLYLVFRVVFMYRGGFFFIIYVYFFYGFGVGFVVLGFLK